MGKIALVAFVALMVTGSVAFLSSKVFVSHARILILSSSPAERASRPTFGDAGAVFSSPQDQVLTQVAIIKSPALAEKLAIELGPQRVLEEMAWKWDWLRALPGEVKNSIVTSLYGWDMTAELLTTIGIRKPGASGSAGPPVAAARDKLLDGLRAGAIVKTDMFSVSFAAPSGEFAAEALNVMIDVYVEHMVELRRPSDTAMIAQKEAERLEKVLGQAETELQDFSRQHEILSIERQKDLLLDRWSRMQDELTQAQGDLGETESKLATIKKMTETLPRQESISVTTRPNPVVDRLRERLVQLQAELQRYVEGSAAARRLKSEIDTISAQLEREAAAVSGQQTVGSSALFQDLANRGALEAANKEALEVRILFLNKELSALDSELNRIVSLELEYRQYERTVQAREEAYRYALLKREETVIQSSIAQASFAQVVPVERGDTPSKASSPRRFRLIVLGIVAGLLAGVGLAYVFEFSRRTVSTTDEAEIAFGLPVLAVTERFGILTKRLQRTRLEMRRLAVWVLRQTMPDRGPRLLFVSAHRRTGQTLLVSELADSLRKQGADVLTLELELDERKASELVFKPSVSAADTPPKFTAKLRAPAGEMRRCLKDFLDQVGRKPVSSDVNKKVEDNVQNTEGDASGDTPLPAASTTAVKDFPASGVILIDGPDIARFPELGSLSSELVDKVVPLIEADRTKTSEVWDLVEVLRMGGHKLPGMVLTKRQRKNSSWAFIWMASSRRRARESS